MADASKSKSSLGPCDLDSVPHQTVSGVNQPDAAAIQFAIGFYDALGAGKSIPEAFAFGCNAIALQNLPADLTPVLKKKL
jgi:hypothetical protein